MILLNDDVIDNWFWCYSVSQSSSHKARFSATSKIQETFEDVNSLGKKVKLQGFWFIQGKHKHHKIESHNL